MSKFYVLGAAVVALAIVPAMRSTAAKPLSTIAVVAESQLAAAADGRGIHDRDTSCVGGLDISDKSHSCIWVAGPGETAYSAASLVQDRRR